MDCDWVTKRLNSQGLVFIHPNPANPEKYVLICTATAGRIEEPAILRAKPAGDPVKC